MDAQKVATTAAVLGLMTSTSFIVGVSASSGLDYWLVANAGVGLGAVSIGLLAGAQLYRLIDDLRNVVAALCQEAADLRVAVATHKTHDREALERAAALNPLDTTGPNSIRHLHRN